MEPPVYRPRGPTLPSSHRNNLNRPYLRPACISRRCLSERQRLCCVGMSGFALGLSRGAVGIVWRLLLTGGSGTDTDDVFLIVCEQQSGHRQGYNHADKPQQRPPYRQGEQYDGRIESHGLAHYFRGAHPHSWPLQPPPPSGGPHAHRSTLRPSKYLYSLSYVRISPPRHKVPFWPPLRSPDRYHLPEYR